MGTSLRIFGFVYKQPLRRITEIAALEESIAYPDAGNTFRPGERTEQGSRKPSAALRMR